MFITLVAVFNDGQSIRVVADTCYRSDDSARMDINQPHRAARRRSRVETRATRNNCIASIRGYCSALGAAWMNHTVRIHLANDGDACNLGVRIVGDSEAHVDDRHVVSPVVGDDDLLSIGCPANGERPCLAIRVIRPYPDAGNLGACGAQSGAIDVDDGDCVSLKIYVRTFSGRDSEQLTVRARLDAEGAGLDGDARCDFDNRNTLQRLLQIHHGYVLGARVPREQVSSSVATPAKRQKLRIR